MKNHLKFKKCVYDMAGLFLVGMEKLYTYEGSVNKDEEDKYRHKEIASTYSTRVLLTRYLHLRHVHERDSDSYHLPISNKVVNPVLFDEAWLLDTDIAHSSPVQLERFDHLPQPVEGEMMTSRELMLQVGI